MHVRLQDAHTVVSKGTQMSMRVFVSMPVHSKCSQTKYMNYTRNDAKLFYKFKFKNLRLPAVNQY